MRSGILAHKALILCMMLVIAAALIAVFYTNTTLNSIEKNLPNSLLTELNALSNIMDDASSVVTISHLARISNNVEDLHKLDEAIALLQQHIVNLRDTYVSNNLVNASALHAILAPAVADLQIWRSNGISGLPADSPFTLEILENRIAEAYQKALRIKHDSQDNAQAILDIQKKRLGLFQRSATFLYVLTLLIVLWLIILLIRQNVLKNREIAATRKLRDQHDILDRLLQNIPLGIVVWDKDKNILHLNNSFTEITGYDQNDMPHLSEWPLLAYPDPSYRQQVRAHWKEHVATDQSCEYKVTRKDGRVCDIEFRATFLSDNRVLNTLTDVSERNRSQKDLLESREMKARSKKMESLGLLAGGVAHDLNNILSGIVSYPELLLMDMESNDRYRKPIEIMKESGQRATAIVQDLLTVARGVAISKESCNVNAIVEDYLRSPDFEILQQHHSKVQVITSLADDLLPIMGSKVHVRKMLMNLVSNGCEAIENTGNVYISTTNTYVDRPLRGYETVEEGEYVVLSVTDQGSGISDEDLEHIFEPFYSKKVMGRSGTGLGLAVVWNVVQDHNGFIDVQSSDTGTAFHVSLPATRQNVVGLKEANDITSIMGNGERILVVDDVESQRFITSSILEKLGYHCETAESGEEAVKRIKVETFDLVILDMIMDPGMNGRQTFEKIIEICPQQKAIIASGFAETDEVKETLRQGASFFLRKPIKIYELAVALRNTLTGQDISCKAES